MGARKGQLSQAQLDALARGRRKGVEARRLAASAERPLPDIERRVRRLTPDSPEVRRIIQEVLSIQEELSQPRPQDAPVLALFAQALQLTRVASADIQRHGLTDSAGKERPAVRVFLEATRRAMELSDRLGFSPAARSKLGVAPGAPSLLAELRRAYGADDGQPRAPTIDGEAKEVDHDGSA